ncbi:hypothetical protein ACQ4PT_001244 [Festuca glaucescens]
MRPPQGGRQRRASLSSCPGGRACNLLLASIPPLLSPSEDLQASPAGLLLDEKPWRRGRSPSTPLPEPLQCLELLTCHDCGHCSEILEPFLDLSLEIGQVDNLVAALESFTKVGQIGDAENKLTCDSCNAQIFKDKRFVIDKTPDVVAFHLKRFTTLDNSIEKIDKYVGYPSELDLKLFHSNPEKEVCTIRSSPTSWHLMNDSLVDSISETSALGQEAYILFYVRQGSFPWFSSMQEEATEYQTKSEYYNMTLGPNEPHLQYAIKLLSAQNREGQRYQEMSRQIVSFPGHGTIITAPGEAPDDHVNTLLSLGMNSTHHRSRVFNNNPAPPAPAKEAPKEPKFSCPVCMNELVNASSTTCGHIFCHKCIRASIHAQTKCPTCRRTLSLSDFHRVYLPTMD